jgi:hypothetical protein
MNCLIPWLGQPGIPASKSIKKTIKPHEKALFFDRLAQWPTFKSFALAKDRTICVSYQKQMIYNTFLPWVSREFFSLLFFNIFSIFLL